jgi:hypothetical protein
VTEAKRVLPQLEEMPSDDESKAYGFSHFQALLSQGLVLQFSVKAGVLEGNISIADPSARYPDESSIHAEINAFYAQLIGPATGSALADNPNLKLAVLDVLHSSGVINLGEPAELAQFVMGAPFDLEKNGYDLLVPAYDFLSKIPLTAAQLDTVISLNFDGGNEIYRYAYYHWGGETDDFEVHSFDGIAALGSLTAISIEGCCRVRDLSQLIGSQVRELQLALGKYSQTEVLLTLSNLAELSVFDDTLTTAMTAALEAKGVSITVY